MVGRNPEEVTAAGLSTLPSPRNFGGQPVTAKTPAGQSSMPMPRPLCGIGSFARSRGSIPSEAAQWGGPALAAKNTLSASDAPLLGVGFELRLSALEPEGPPQDAGLASPEAGEQASL